MRTSYDGEAQAFRAPQPTSSYKRAAITAAAVLTVGALFLSSSSGSSPAPAAVNAPSAEKIQLRHTKRDASPIGQNLRQLRNFKDVEPFLKQKSSGKGAKVKRQAVGSSSAALPGPTASSAPAPGGGATSGGPGSTITMANGETFVYNNTFGGTWASEPGDFSARPQARSPALNETWDWNEYRTHGVNLGGWLVTEPFIVPNLYIPYQNATPRAVDEYTLSQALGDQLEAVMIDHYETFITEQDFAQIAAAGMNWIRLPVPFWAVETVEDEPYLEGHAWNYMLQAFEWARKYGLRVELDLHTVPGSQNGLNHSGRLGSINFLNGVMGVVNAQRTLNCIRVLTELVSQPAYRHVMLFNIVNEAYVSTIGPQAIRQFYFEAYETMRNITGIGAGNGPFMVIHDGFIGLETWNGFLEGSDRLSLESHYYFAFSPDSYETNFYNMVTRPCQWWAPGFNQSTLDNGLTIGGEWSIAPNDCGLWLNAVGEGSYFDGSHSNSNGRSYGSCTQYTDVRTFSDTFKEQLRAFTLANMDTFQNFMFWTWKTQSNLETGACYNPLWSYSCGLENNYVPRDPNDSAGACNRLGPQYGGGYGRNVPLTTPYQASQTGGTATTSSIVAAQTQQYGQWPPNALTNIGNGQNLPRYTTTGQAPSFPTEVPTPLSQTATGVSFGSAYYTPIAGCSYLDPYQGVGAQVPNSPCTGSGARQTRATPTSQPSFGAATSNVIVTSLASPTGF